MTSKPCVTCGVEKCITLFYTQKGAKYGTAPTCKECTKEKRRKYRAEYPDKVKASRIKCTYGISVGEVQNMFKNQNGKCASCGDKPVKNDLVIDHCHSTGAVRGLLCSPCNLMLGHSKDNPDRLRQAALYLERFLND
jgi:hypothetical protein